MKLENEIIEHYQKCINKIDDYLEYLYKSDDKEKVRKKILSYIDELSEKIMAVPSTTVTIYKDKN